MQLKKLVVCIDGTWDEMPNSKSPASGNCETNVARFFNAVENPSKGGDTLAKYIPGVGTGSLGESHTHWALKGLENLYKKRFVRLYDGMTGQGIDTQILEGYKYLVETYDSGDKVYLVGFSRGAYSARSLAGLIRNCGLLDRNRKGLTDDNLNHLAIEAYEIYRERDDSPDSPAAVKFRKQYSREIEIEFIGAWDTVKALGFPLRAFNSINDNWFRFHDARLSKIVKNAYHAIALDEHRVDFDVVLWDPKVARGQKMEQRWFSGSHGDVGGGNENSFLSYISLEWMLKMAEATGLTVKHVQPHSYAWNADIYDSYFHFLGGKYKRHTARHLRPVAPGGHDNQTVDPSVDQRLDNKPDYRPQNPGFLPRPTGIRAWLHAG